jgi:aspartyl-tRNA(Asn)/glutamyl-tRNA(Gln) amidotransferase subunit C
MSLDLDQVRKVAKLARLEASDADLARVQQQLSAIFDYVDQVQKLNTEGVEELAHPLPVRNVFRDDVPAPSLPVDEALRNAPLRAGNYFGVPAVFDTGEPRRAYA